MTTKLPRNRHKSVAEADDIDKLYLALLRAFYEKADYQRARQIATHLEPLLEGRADIASSIRGEEMRSLLAELRGDLSRAIRSRECEIRKILELYSHTVDTPHRDYVQRQYDYSDVSDRLDLLAALYAEQGDLERAIETLQESKQFAEAHAVPFDGQDLLDEFEQARRAKVEVAPQPKGRRAATDEAVRAAYANLKIPVKDILIDDAKASRFRAEVLRRTKGKFAPTMREIKRRLLTLRSRGAANGGLPRLQRSGG